MAIFSVGTTQKSLLPTVAIALLVLLLGAGQELANPATAQTDQQQSETSEADVSPAVESSSNVDLGNDEIYATSLAALTILLVAAILIENALAVIFNWRVFLTYFSLRGVRTLVMIVVALIAVITFDIDIVAALMAAYKNAPVDSGPVSIVLTAFILGGGSSSVNNIMNGLGLRERTRAEAIAPKAPPTQAWVAFDVKRENAVGHITVHIDEDQSTGGQAPLAVAGSIGRELPKLKELLFRNVDRFPQNGGYVLEPNKSYVIELHAKDASMQLHRYDADGSLLSTGQAGRPYSFAPGAIVDFKVTL